MRARTDRVYFGSGATGNTEAILSVQTVAKPGAVPVEVSITATTSGIQLTHAVSAAEIADSAPKLDLETDLDE